MRNKLFLPGVPAGLVIAAYLDAPGKELMRTLVVYPG